jgi:hypothetical protein
MVKEERKEFCLNESKKAHITIDKIYNDQKNLNPEEEDYVTGVVTNYLNLDSTLRRFVRTEDIESINDIAQQAKATEDKINEKPEIYDSLSHGGIKHGIAKIKRRSNNINEVSKNIR